MSPSTRDPGAPNPTLDPGEDDADTAPTDAQREADTARLGTVLAGRYRIDSLLGRGGMGTVYRATHLALGEPMAVKFLEVHWSANREMRARFRREAVLLARLRHPGIVTVIDHGESAGQLYLVMELLRGQTLDAYAEARGGALDPAEVAALGDQVLQVLEAAHAAGVVHRDLKPENLMLVDGGPGAGPRVKVLDFGIAQATGLEGAERLTVTGTVRGTPCFMSPEQCTGDGVGPASDVYSLGVVLYELLTGRLPFEGGSAAELMARHLFAPPPKMTAPEGRPPLPPGLEALVLRALSKRPEARPSATEFRVTLAAALLGTDPVSVAARESAARTHAAGLSRDERALPPAPMETLAGVATAAPSPGVVLWGFAPERAAALGTALGMEGMIALGWSEASPPPGAVQGRAARAVVIPGDGAAVERVRALRGVSATARMPVLVLDVRAVETTAALIRAGASDVAPAGTDDAALCRKLQRLVRRGR